MSTQNNIDNFLDAIVEANNMIKYIDSSPFSQNAYKELLKKINEYIGSIIIESIKISKRHNTDIVSKNQVEQANNNLISKRKGKLKYFLGSIGGMLIGAVLSNLVNFFVFNANYSTNGIVILAVLGIIGGFMWGRGAINER